jgi:pumilio homology domain family member 6
MVHTRDGSRAVREFVVRGTAKDRKQVLKALKPHIQRMCADDEAQLVLFTCLDVVDDTKLLAKSVVAPIVEPESARALLASPQGRRALLYLVVPRSSRHFTPAQVRSIAETDGVRDGVEGQEGTSKKDAEVRRREVREAASEELIKGVVVEGGEVWRDPGGSLVVGDVMLYTEGGKIRPHL